MFANLIINMLPFKNFAFFIQMINTYWPKLRAILEISSLLPDLEVDADVLVLDAGF